MEKRADVNNHINVNCSTKEIIMSAAKQQFYEQGYLKTTIASIFKKTDIPMGVFSYHYKTKDNLVREIFAQYYRDIEELIIKNFNIPSDKYFLKHVLVSRIFYKVILENSNNSRFYHEVIRDKSTFRFNGKIILEKNKNLLSEFNVIVTEEEFQSIMVMSSGARREFFLNYFESNIKMSINQIVNILESLAPRMLKIDQNLIDSILLKSIDLVDSLDYSTIKFLV